MYNRLYIYHHKNQSIMKSNWKTTLGGVLAAVGSYLVNSQTGWVNVLGQVCQAVGLFFLGASAKDASTTK